MNLIWNKNILLFEKRFPQLCELIADHISFFKKFAGTDDEINLYPFWKISESKIHTPIAEENGLRLHSAYNPIRESDSFITSQSDKISEKESIVFLGMGLGYPVISACEKFQKKTIIIIEPDIKKDDNVGDIQLNSIDHLEMFKTYILNTLGNSSDVEHELEEVLK